MNFFFWPNTIFTMTNRAGNLYSAKSCRNKSSVPKISFFGYPKKAN